MKNREETCKKILDCLSFRLTGELATLKYSEYSQFAFVMFGPYMLCHGPSIRYLFQKTCCTPYQHIVDDIIKIASESNLIHIPWIDKDGYACYRQIVPQNVTFDELVVMSDLELLP